MISAGSESNSVCQKWDISMWLTLNVCCRICVPFIVFCGTFSIFNFDKRFVCVCEALCFLPSQFDFPSSHSKKNEREKKGAIRLCIINRVFSSMQTVEFIQFTAKWKNSWIEKYPFLRLSECSEPFIYGLLIFSFLFCVTYQAFFRVMLNFYQFVIWPLQIQWTSVTKHSTYIWALHDSLCSFKHGGQQKGEFVTCVCFILNCLWSCWLCGWLYYCDIWCLPLNIFLCVSFKKKKIKRGRGEAGRMFTDGSVWHQLYTLK